MTREILYRDLRTAGPLTFGSAMFTTCRHPLALGEQYLRIESTDGVVRRYCSTCTMRAYRGELEQQ